MFDMRRGASRTSAPLQPTLQVPQIVEVLRSAGSALVPDQFPYADVRQRHFLAAPTIVASSRPSHASPNSTPSIALIRSRRFGGCPNWTMVPSGSRSFGPARPWHLPVPKIPERRKETIQVVSVARVEETHITGEAGVPIEDRGLSADDHVSNAVLAQEANEVAGVGREVRRIYLDR